MTKLIPCALVAAALAAAPAIAQTTSPQTNAPAASPGTSSPGGTTQGTDSKGTGTDAAAVAKFKAADKNANGMLEGDETTAYRAQLSSIDTNKDGKISHIEFTVGMTAGHIK